MRARTDGRKPDELRPIALEPGHLRHAEGSCLVRFGDTRVICAATVTEGVPGWRKGTGSGWVTAEYNMLPRSGMERVPRSSQRGGRSLEIQRTISRALRASIDLDALGENTILIDCDVIEADGGTRTASITGGMIALHQAVEYLKRRRLVKGDPIHSFVAAVSVGLVETVPLLDLAYDEDSRADVDMNVVMTEKGEIVEVQGAAEGVPFSREEMNGLIGLAEVGIRRLTRLQREAIDGS